MTINFICVDDEPLARQGLKLAVAPYPDFHLVAEFGAADEALAADQNKELDNIDVIFVDIEMPRQNGFDMIQQWRQPLPIVVFITAYDQYAVKAFEEQALDYLLKPIDEDRFAQVVERIKQRLLQQNDSVTSEQLTQVVEKLRKKLSKNQAEISVKTDEGYYRIKLSDLLYIESVGDHVCLNLKDKQLITRCTLKKYVAELEEHGFHQIHKTLLVNASHVKQVAKLRFGDSEVTMSNGSRLRASRRYKSAIEKFVSGEQSA